MITIEPFGVHRLRAGRESVTLEAPTLKRALDELARICPGLDGTVIDHGRIHPTYRVCLNGDRFVSDPATPIADGDVLLLLAAGVGADARWTAGMAVISGSFPDRDGPPASRGRIPNEWKSRSWVNPIRAPTHRVVP